ncbi:uncharacterized protein LOC123546384 isoform X2 [Mercenaria mercenaria]|uniref:uncharacterized protein LOC123546384 isoform X2 n=1 Tax=Mercenaria mercenaria TaxID=6596 RepID=UPI00234F066A|nr:uncharacterized protein LOC123546384 isoform X2 [Mercenaria mercenaria]
MAFHYNIIYNDTGDTDDSELALTFVQYLDNKMSGWGFNGYYAEKHARPGRSVFDELFRIVKETENTLVVITPHFRSSYWAKYSKQAAFKYLLEEGNQHKLIPIAINIRNKQALEELNVNTPILIKGLTEQEWEDNNKNCFERLKKVFLSEDSRQVVEEIGDNRLRTEERQQLVTRPSSETSLSSVASSLSDERHSSNASLPDTTQSVILYDRSMPDPRIYSYTQPQNNYNLQDNTEADSFPSADGNLSSGDSSDFSDKTRQKSTTSPDKSKTEIIPDQTRMLDHTDRTDPDNERRSSLRNNVAANLATGRNHYSISDDNDLSMDILPQDLPTNTENANEMLESRPETLGAEAYTSNKEMPKLPLGPFDQDDRNEVSEGSPDSEQTNPKYAQSESGYTTLSQNTPSPDGQVPPQHQTDDDKIITHDLSFHSGSETDPTAIEHTAAVHHEDEKEAGAFGNEENKQSKGSETDTTAVEHTAALHHEDGKEADAFGNVENKQSKGSETDTTAVEHTAVLHHEDKKEADAFGNEEKKQSKDAKSLFEDTISMFNSILNSDLANSILNIDVAFK